MQGVELSEEDVRDITAETKRRSDQLGDRIALANWLVRVRSPRLEESIESMLEVQGRDATEAAVANLCQLARETFSKEVFWGDVPIDERLDKPRVCPKCFITRGRSNREVRRLFGERRDSGVIRCQSHCRWCRSISKGSSNTGFAPVTTRVTKLTRSLLEAEGVHVILKVT